MSKDTTRTFKLVVAYNGARFKGWQRGNGRTVQGTLEEALSASLPVASRGAIGEPGDCQVNGAGRTDAGAHAEGQVASVVLPDSVDRLLLLEEVNRNLPSDLAVNSVDEMDARFHARYRATAKTYRYRIVDGAVGNPFLSRLAWRVRANLDVDRMKEASHAFIGSHDFTSFTADKGKKEKTRTVHEIGFARASVLGGDVLDIRVRGDGFLWNQVRIMASALVAVGRGDTDVSSVAAILESCERSLAPPPAPAWGLTLVSVE